MKSKVCLLCTICLISALALSFSASCESVPESAPPSPIEVTDQLGRVVRLETAPQRIISLAPSNTEVLFALGLADRVVAVTDYCNYPPEAEAKPSIGGFSTPNMEEIVALSPDLILATSIHESKVISQLESKGLTVLALNPKTVNEVLEAILLTGKVAGVEENASELAAEMQQRIKAVTDKIASLSPEEKLKTCYVVWFSDEGLMVAGADTLQDEIIDKAGGLNIGMEVKDYASIDIETVIGLNPEVMIVGTGHGSSGNDTFDYTRTEARLRDIDARQNERIYGVDSDSATRPGPRIVDGLEQFARFIHPELFE